MRGGGGDEDGMQRERWLAGRGLGGGSAVSGGEEGGGEVVGVEGEDGGCAAYDEPGYQGVVVGEGCGCGGVGEGFFERCHYAAEPGHEQ